MLHPIFSTNLSISPHPTPDPASEISAQTEPLYSWKQNSTFSCDRYRKRLIDWSDGNLIGLIACLPKDKNDSETFICPDAASDNVGTDLWQRPSGAILSQEIPSQQSGQNLGVSPQPQLAEKKPGPSVVSRRQFEQFFKATTNQLPSQSDEDVRFRKLLSSQQDSCIQPSSLLSSSQMDQKTSRSREAMIAHSQRQVAILFHASLPHQQQRLITPHRANVNLISFSPSILSGSSSLFVTADFERLCIWRLSSIESPPFPPPAPAPAPGAGISQTVVKPDPVLTVDQSLADVSAGSGGPTIAKRNESEGESIGGHRFKKQWTHQSLFLQHLICVQWVPSFALKSLLDVVNYPSADFFPPQTIGREEEISIGSLRSPSTPSSSPSAAVASASAPASAASSGLTTAVTSLEKKFVKELMTPRKPNSGAPSLVAVSVDGHALLIQYQPICDRWTEETIRLEPSDLLLPSFRFSVDCADILVISPEQVQIAVSSPAFRSQVKLFLVSLSPSFHIQQMIHVNGHTSYSRSVRLIRHNALPFLPSNQLPSTPSADLLVLSDDGTSQYLERWSPSTAASGPSHVLSPPCSATSAFDFHLTATREFDLKDLYGQRVVDLQPLLSGHFCLLLADNRVILLDSAFQLLKDMKVSSLSVSQKDSPNSSMTDFLSEVAVKRRRIDQNSSSSSLITSSPLILTPHSCDSYESSAVSAIDSRSNHDEEEEEEEEEDNGSDGLVSLNSCLSPSGTCLAVLDSAHRVSVVLCDDWKMLAQNVCQWQSGTNDISTLQQKLIADSVELCNLLGRTHWDVNVLFHYLSATQNPRLVRSLVPLLMNDLSALSQSHRERYQTRFFNSISQLLRLVYGYKALYVDLQARLFLCFIKDTFASFQVRVNSEEPIRIISDHHHQTITELLTEWSEWLFCFCEFFFYNLTEYLSNQSNVKDAGSARTIISFFVKANPAVPCASLFFDKHAIDLLKENLSNAREVCNILAQKNTKVAKLLASYSVSLWLQFFSQLSERLGNGNNQEFDQSFFASIRHFLSEFVTTYLIKFKSRGHPISSSVEDLLKKLDLFVPAFSFLEQNQVKSSGLKQAVAPSSTSSASSPISPYAFKFSPERSLNCTSVRDVVMGNTTQLPSRPIPTAVLSQSLPSSQALLQCSNCHRVTAASFDAPLFQRWIFCCPICNGKWM